MGMLYVRRRPRPPATGFRPARVVATPWSEERLCDVPPCDSVPSVVGFLVFDLYFPLPREGSRHSVATPSSSRPATVTNLSSHPQPYRRPVRYRHRGAPCARSLLLSVCQMARKAEGRFS